MNVVAPLPLEELPELSREDAALARRFRASARAVDPVALEGALGDLVRTPVTIRAGAPRRAAVDRTDLTDAAIAIVIAADPGPAVLISVENALANMLVARALDQRSPRIPGPSSVSDVIGAFAAVLHAALRRACDPPRALRVVAAGTSSTVAREFPASARQSTLPLLVSFGGDSFGARVTANDADLATETPPLSAAALENAEDLPLALPLVAATCIATRSEIALLAPGDAFVFGGTAFGLEGDRLLGEIVLAAGASERGLRAVLAPDDRLVLRTDVPAALPWDLPRDSAMTNASSASPAASGSAHLDALEDAPVVVRVELGSVAMTAKEWAALSPGDAIALGRAVGAPAVLRVGGVEVAQGELVRIGGEYGVRILARGESR